jgi:hypothetical protein
MAGLAADDLPGNATEIKAPEADAGRYLDYVRVIGRRLPGAKLEELIVSMPAQYTKAPLLRQQEE